MNIINKMSRRQFVKRIMLLWSMLTLGASAKATPLPREKIDLENIKSTVYRAINGSPRENMTKVIELLGGIEKVIGEEDVVVIKPNVQWWNQGSPNLSALASFVELIFHRPGGFRGEVVIAENCHRGNQPCRSLSSGWESVFERNSDIEGVGNFNDLASYLKKKYGRSYSTCHWIDVDAGGRRVYGPADGTGYVYCDGTGGVPLLKLDNGATGDEQRSVIMTYPIFKTDKKTIVDFKYGIWEGGGYTDRPLKFINFAALNHHSTYCGATSSVKNYLGISDISGGPDPLEDGKLTADHYNFHSFPLDKWKPGPVPGMLGLEIGMFMDTVRKADLNITTAEWVGLCSRTEPPVASTKVVLASEDPVALDYHATKYVLHPNSKISVHNPDNKQGPLYQSLEKCAERSGSILNENKIDIMSYDFMTKRLQNESEFIVIGEKEWGSDLKLLAKYFILRFF